MKEEWRSLKGLVPCGDYYEVSNLGRVRSIDRWITYKNGHKHFYKGKILKSNVNKSNGYESVILSLKGITKTLEIHRLVALAFVPNPNNFLIVNHKDECKTNNSWLNLEWCTKSYNATYGTCPQRMSESRKGLKPNEETRRKMSESHKNKTTKKVNVFNYKTKEFICECNSVKETYEKVGVAKSSVIRVLKGKLKQVKGYYFEYVD